MGLAPVPSKVRVWIGTSTWQATLRGFGKLGVLALVQGAQLALASGPVTMEPSRGELLYSTNCLGCHAEQVHWRDKRLVRDWQSLISQVQHWQGFSQLGWSEDDIELVARYLNASYYHYVAPER